MNPSSSTTAVNAEPTPGQHQRYTNDEDEEALDKIPGDADDPHGSKQENKDKDELSHTWKTNEFWNYVDSHWRSSVMKYVISSQIGIFRIKNSQSMCHIIVFVNPLIYCFNKFFTKCLQEDWKMYPSTYSWSSFAGNVTYPHWQEGVHKKCSW